MILSWLEFFTLGWGIPVFAYILLQACALVTVRGPSRLGLWVPVPVMAVVTGHMFWAYHQEASLWPMTMLMVTPGCLLAVAALWAAALVSNPCWKTAIPFICACSATILLASMNDHGVGILWKRRSLDLAAVLVACGLATRVTVQLWRRRRTTGCS